MLAPNYAASSTGRFERSFLAPEAERRSAEVAAWKIAKFLEGCRREFGQDRSLIAETERFGLMADQSRYLKHRQVEAGITLFRAYDKERQREIRKQLVPLMRKPASDF